MEEIIQATRHYLQVTLLHSNEIELHNDTALISSGILDSISTLKLVDFLEKKYQFDFLPHEVDKEHLDTLQRIAEFVISKTNS